MGEVFVDNSAMLGMNPGQEKFEQGGGKPSNKPTFQVMERLA